MSTAIYRDTLKQKGTIGLGLFLIISKRQDALLW